MFHIILLEVVFGVQM